MDKHLYNLPDLESENGEWDERAHSRQGFLRLCFWSVTGLSLTAVGGGSVRFLLGHSLTAPAGEWIEVGALNELPPGQMHRVTYLLRTTDLWRKGELRGVLYAYSEDGSSYTVLSGTCTHLGCNVRWDDAQQQFACPCHLGLFSRQGEVLSGPPPKALNRLETRIENGKLLAFV